MSYKIDPNIHKDIMRLSEKISKLIRKDKVFKEDRGAQYYILLISSIFGELFAEFTDRLFIQDDYRADRAKYEFIDDIAIFAKKLLDLKKADISQEIH